MLRQPLFPGKTRVNFLVWHSFAVGKVAKGYNHAQNLVALALLQEALYDINERDGATLFPHLHAANLVLNPVFYGDLIDEIQQGVPAYVGDFSRVGKILDFGMRSAPPRTVWGIGGAVAGPNTFRHLSEFAGKNDLLMSTTSATHWGPLDNRILSNTANYQEHTAMVLRLQLLYALGVKKFAFWCATCATITSVEGVYRLARAEVQTNATVAEDASWGTVGVGVTLYFGSSWYYSVQNSKRMVEENERFLVYTVPSVLVRESIFIAYSLLCPDCVQNSHLTVVGKQVFYPSPAKGANFDVGDGIDHFMDASKVNPLVDGHVDFPTIPNVIGYMAANTLSHSLTNVLCFAQIA